MSFYINKKFNPLKQIFKLIVYFSIFIFIYQIFFLDFNIKNIFLSLTLNTAIALELPLIQGSYWFVPTYCTSIIATYIIINNFENKGMIFIVLFLIYYFIEYLFNISIGYNFLGTPIDSLLFYTSCILVGYYFSKYRNNKFLPIIALLCLCIYVIIVALNNNAFNLQKYKFPVGLPYVIASFISLSLVMYGKKFKQKTLLTYIGKNSIFFYISQGISGSVILKIQQYINEIWQIKFILLFFN